MCEATERHTDPMITSMRRELRDAARWLLQLITGEWRYDRGRGAQSREVSDATGATGWHAASHMDPVKCYCVISQSEDQLLNCSYVGVGCVFESSSESHGEKCSPPEGESARFKGEAPASSSHLLIILEQTALAPSQNNRKTSSHLLPACWFHTNTCVVVFL